MAEYIQKLAAKVQDRFADGLENSVVVGDELTITVSRERLRETCLALRDESGYSFRILIDLCGVDYQAYGESAWSGPRFAVVYHLLSVENNQRIRVKVFLEEDSLRVPTVVDIWASANWYEREAFDLYGILFDEHPDLRRLLTDYGFVGHPFRKDFPLSGNVEMRYDPERKRVIYEPVTIEPRVTVPRVIRHDHRYMVGHGDDPEEVERG